MTEAFVLRIAEVNVGVKPYSEKLREWVSDYVVTGVNPDFSLEITEEDVKAESESLALERKLAEGLLPYDVLLFHASALSIDGFGYAYSAPSGTGKSTHAALIRKEFGARVKMVNDDKPFIRVRDGEVRAYGSPWCGKHNLGSNISVPLHGICFLNQHTENLIERVDPVEAFMLMLRQVYKAQGSVEAVSRVMDLIEQVLKTVPVYALFCTVSPEAARLSVKTMARIRFEDILKRDGELVYRTVGTSMEPMLHENKSIVIIKAAKPEDLKPDDVILYKRHADGKYILHRLLWIRDNEFVTVGDNQWIKMTVRPDEILGVLTSYIDEGREIPVTDPEYLRYVRKYCHKSLARRHVRFYLRSLVNRAKGLVKKVLWKKS